jgi:ubiquitin-conjugating enzyme E2 variant
MVIAPFREHHLDPGALARHGWLERNGNSCLAALPLLALAEWPASGRGNGWAVLAKGFFAGLAITLAVTNQIHAWAHATTQPRWVRWLQRRGLFIAPERHKEHHGASHGRAYAVVSGWSNRWLDGTLSYVERILAGLGIPANASEHAS